MNPSERGLDRLEQKFERPAEAPVFDEPWQAQAFALTLLMHQKGLFTWVEWAAALAAEIKAAGGDALGPIQGAKAGKEEGSAYYQYWLAATEKLVAQKQIISAAALHERREAWDRAAQATPHGAEIRLENDPTYRAVNEA